MTDGVRNGEKRVRVALDSWQFWVAVAYFGLVAMIVALAFLYREVTEEQAIRAADQRAGAVSQVETCYARVDTAPDLRGIVEAIEAGILDRIRATKATLAAEPDGPLVKVRRSSLQRQRAQLVRTRSFGRRLVGGLPTLHECDELADSLNVPRRSATAGRAGA